VKYLLLLLLVGYGVWRWRVGQRARAAPPRPAGLAQAEPIAVVACARCGLHVPITQAVTSGARYFCSASHREAAGV